ncbi:hypothetical protein BHS07_37575 [Myxococcus xanthus]|nr:hypothetical protein BHS07_37575 [Myxococcus xanthus]QDF00937.1 hypothetical protein BHS05_36820 [Myxococcus xanthus]
MEWPEPECGRRRGTASRPCARDYLWRQRRTAREKRRAMAISKRGLVDRVKEVAVQAGTRGARVLLGTAVVTARGVANLQSKIRGTPASGRVKTAAEGTRRTAKAARGVIESGKPTKAPARRMSPSTKTAAAAGANNQVGRKSVPGQAAAAKRGTAKKARPATKAKRGQKHRH